ncbi:DUF2971 domain-containing protein [uncultured Eubacterium sp.]|uniref:DUF2971 domain-containing protein n=1 Tax=uncultured Eubacterium sp. TaxID=165185 RepID=UPI0032671781
MAIDLWKKEMMDNIFIKNNYKKVFEIKNEYAPRKLYRYRTGTIQKKVFKKKCFDIENLKNNKMWASAVSQFNDPFDCRLMIDLMDLVPKYLKDSERLQKKAHKGNYELNKRIGDEIYVICFSEKCDSIPMWSYYANNHKGFCIEYERADLKKAYPVVYTNESIKVEDANLLSYNTYIKSEQWEHEKEWRIVRPDKPNKNKGILIDSCKPTAIYVGCRASDELKMMLSGYCIENNVKIYQMNMNPKEYKLEIKG